MSKLTITIRIQSWQFSCEPALQRQAELDQAYERARTELARIEMEYHAEKK